MDKRKYYNIFVSIVIVWCRILPSSIVRDMNKYVLPSLLPRFLQLIMDCHPLKRGKLIKPSLCFCVLQNSILLFHTELVLILFHSTLNLSFAFLLLFFIFSVFNLKLLSCSFCYAIQFHLVLGLLLKINVDLSLHIFISTKLKFNPWPDVFMRCWLTGQVDLMITDKCSLYKSGRTGLKWFLAFLWCCLFVFNFPGNL